MDTTSLRLAYGRLLDAADRVTGPGTHHPPPPGEWDASQLLAHLVLVDAGVLAVAWSVAAGGRPDFDNRSSLDAGSLARIEQRFGGPVPLRERIRTQGDALCALAEELTDDELDQLVPTLLQSGDTVLVDAPLPLRDLLAGLAEDHLPRHTDQLLALLAPATPAG
jgi:hypothetical protein